MYEIRFNKRSVKFLKSVPKEQSSKIIKKIISLSGNPFPPEAKKIINVRDRVFRLRSGKYRILYTASLEKKEICISKIDKREGAYKKFVLTYR